MNDTGRLPETPDERRRIALHEAGHAVAHTVLGTPPDYVSIRNGRTFAGISVPVTDPLDTTGAQFGIPIVMEPPALRARVERQVISSLAGRLAEMYLAESAIGRYASDAEPETIARQALEALEPRMAEIVREHEAREEPDPRDEENAHDLVQAFAGPEAGMFYLEWLRVCARELVIRYRAAILRVADALERQAVLVGHQVHALTYPRKET